MRRGALLAAAPVLIAGLLPLEAELSERWCWAGAWRLPIGDPWRLGAAGPAGEPPFRLLRGLHRGDSLSRAHDGADLGNGRAGDPVTAAAHGVVVRAERRAIGGYGCHVVLAHRTREGLLAYSVYAHLARGSIAVRAGERVWAGQPIGRVGRTGRASTDHLHFEVRVADEPGTRWERARTVPPHVFVANRMPAHRADTSWCAPYLAWAETCALLERRACGPDAALDRATWHAMLAHAARHPLERLPRDPNRLREALVAESLLPQAPPPPDGPAAGWDEIVRDLERLHRLGHRLPPVPADPGRHRSAAERRLGSAEPWAARRALARAGQSVRVGDVLLLLADVAGSDPALAGTPATDR